LVVTRVILHIGRLVLRGIDVYDVRSFQAGLETALASTLEHSLANERLRAGTRDERSQRQLVHLPRAATAHRVGACVGRGIAGALRP
jgi:hypothetical protein